MQLRSETARAAASRFISSLCKCLCNQSQICDGDQDAWPITLGYGIPYGLICSFTLPAVLKSVSGIGGFRESSLQKIFGADLGTAAGTLKSFMTGLGVSVRLQDYGVPDREWTGLVDSAFAGERGRNFVGEKSRFYAAAESLGVV